MKKFLLKNLFFPNPEQVKLKEIINQRKNQINLDFKNRITEINNNIYNDINKLIEKTNKKR